MSGTSSPASGSTNAGWTGTGLTGTGRLALLVLRRDRLRLPLWLIVLGGVTVVSAASLVPLYPDQASIDSYAALFGDNPALVAMAGPGYGFDDPNLGVILVNEVQLWTCIGTALMSIFLVNRHTRAEEDVERAEVLRSSVVGRYAPIAAALVVVGTANVVLGAVSALAFVALGYPTVGSIALAGSFTVVGLVFVGVTAAAAQLAGSSRATLGLGSVVLAVAFVLRAVGDIGDNALRWLSPIGWAQSIRAFADEQWWPAALCLSAAVALAVGALALSTRRDLGSGMLPQRPGPPAGRPWSSTQAGLAIRLQRGYTLSWAFGLFLTGIVYGSIAEDVEQMIEDNPTYADFLAQLDGASLTESFLGTSVVMLVTIATGYALSSALRLRTEESSGRLEPVLAGPVSRWRWAGANLAVTGLGTAVVLAAAGLGIGLSYAAVSGDASQALRLTGAALALAPAVWVAIGVAVLLFGLAPRTSMAAWGFFGATVLIGFLGEMLRLPDWLRRVAPVDHLAALPAQSFDLVPFVLLAAIGTVLTTVGLIGFRSRDLAAG